MDLLLLKTFLKVAAVGNITKAAAVLFVTQSAVSRRIKQLEESVGKPLLERTGTSLVPTEAGQLLMEKGRRILDIEQEFFLSIGGARAKQRISFCCTPSPGIDRLSAVTSSFFADHAASVELNCVFTMPEEALAGLDSGRFDLALIDHCVDLDLKGRVTHSLPDDEVAFISAPALGIPEQVSIDRLLCERLYLKNEKGCARRFIDKNLRTLGHSCAHFSSLVFYDDFSFIAREVLAGKGITFASNGIFADELQSRRLNAHRVREFSHLRPRTLILARQELSPQHMLFIDYLFAEFGLTRPVNLHQE
ncbi:MAG: LysR family transcriptional regulator [Geobacteraceae bacterium GWC2_58_44]|nr:MAG: LysR family transcriptional regulator [Geobacteraceae bacterium GWC2_58_44]